MGRVGAVRARIGGAQCGDGCCLGVGLGRRAPQGQDMMVFHRGDTGRGRADGGESRRVYGMVPVSVQVTARRKPLTSRASL